MEKKVFNPEELEQIAGGDGQNKQIKYDLIIEDTILYECLDRKTGYKVPVEGGRYCTRLSQPVGKFTHVKIKDSNLVGYIETMYLRPEN